jgi:NADP-dependent 3-hydroxy acid dehydrogenase YdfG
MNSKVVVITGASSGIGAALARLLGKQEHKVVLAARRGKELAEIAGETGDQTLVVPTDVTRRGEVENLKTTALEKFGRIDVWINNAGRGISKKVANLTDAEFDEMMLVNVKSALYGMQAVLPHFQDRRSGHVINVSSALSRVPFATYRSAYSAAKAALNSLTANLRMDLQAEYPDIHVSLVMPGVVLTDFAKNALGGTPPMPPSATANAQTADEVAAVIAHLIEHPQPEVYTNPASADMVRRYYDDVGKFEANMQRR